MIPVISRNDIEDCFSGETQDKERLSEAKEKTLRKIIMQDPEAWEKMEHRVPYVVGDCTNLQFIRLSRFTDFFQMIDPEGESVAQQT